MKASVLSRISRIGLTVVVGMLFGLLASGTAMAGDEPPELADLSLEELLSRQLGGMAITGIHHTHAQGEWMLGVSSMQMRMAGNRDGSTRLGDATVLADFPVTPMSMNMNMFMVHGMYAPSDDFTVMVMVPSVRKNMRHKTRMGTRFTTRSGGLGDVRLSGLFSIHRSESHRVIAEFGASLPTGSIDEKDDLPVSMGRKVRLPYPMQLGSGTWDLAPGLTYIGQTEEWAWGAHASGVIHTGWNDNEYRLGDAYKVTSWASRKFVERLSMSLRLELGGWGNIDGADPLLNRTMVPTADPKLRAGRRVDLLLGLNLFEAEGERAGNRLALEVGAPIYQHLDGPQLETDWLISLAWDWTF